MILVLYIPEGGVCNKKVAKEQFGYIFALDKARNNGKFMG